CAVDQRHRLAHDVRKHPGEHRVVRTTEHQGVDPSVADGRQVPLGGPLQLYAKGHSVLDELTEPWACLGRVMQVWACGERVFVRLRLERRLGADHANVAVAGSGNGAPDGRLDHLDNGYVVPFTSVP